MRERNKAKRRDAIIDSALALLRHHALAEVSIERIAAGAEVSPATVYNLVGSREQLLFACVDRVVDRLVEQLVVTGDTADPVERATLIVDQTAEAFIEQRADGPPGPPTRKDLRYLRASFERWLNADLCLIVVDGTVGVGATEEQLMALIPESMPRLLIWNKMDHADYLPPLEGAVSCSALCGWGLANVKNAVLQRVASRGALAGDSELIVTNARQAEVLQHAYEALSSARGELNGGAEAEIVAAELRVAASRLGELTGQEVAVPILDEIFSRFCVGK